MARVDRKRLIQQATSSIGATGRLNFAASIPMRYLAKEFRSNLFRDPAFSLQNRGRHNVNGSSRGSSGSGLLGVFSRGNAR